MLKDRNAEQNFVQSKSNRSTLSVTLYSVSSVSWGRAPTIVIQTVTPHWFGIPGFLLLFCIPVTLFSISDPPFGFLAPTLMLCMTKYYADAEENNCTPLWPVSQVISHQQRHDLSFTPYTGVCSGVTGTDPHRFCEMQLLDMVDDIVDNMKQQCMQTDLCPRFFKTFDIVGHKWLLEKLKHCGINGETNSWIKGFLSDCYHCVIVYCHMYC